MAFLNNILEYVAVFASGFFGHVVAHDFCEVTPMISKKIIEMAASRLPASIRDRYLEEWRVDLHDQGGALAKLMWSIGCFRSVFQLRRHSSTEFYRKASVEFVLSTGETIVLDMPSLTLVRSIAATLNFLRQHKRWLPNRVAGGVLWFSVKLNTFRWRRVGNPDYGKVFQVVAAMRKGLPRKVAVWHDGVLVRDITHIAKQYEESDAFQQ